MNEILFRGKRVDNSEWVYGSLVMFPNNEFEIQNFKEIHCGIECNHFKVIPETVGQYTGLKDKNGKKIFEGMF